MTPNRRKRLTLWIVLWLIGLGQLSLLHVDVAFAQSDLDTTQQIVQQANDLEYRPSTLLLGIVPGTAEEEIVSVLRRQGMTLVRLWPELGLAEARIVPATTQAISAASVDMLEHVSVGLENEPAIAFVEYDRVVRAADLPSSTTLQASALDGTTAELPLLEPLPNDPLLDQQWSFSRVEAVNSWNIGQGDANVAIAIIDSGYDVGHPDIDESMLWTNTIERDGLPNVDDDNNGYVDDIHGWDWVDDDNEPADTYGHGTHVLGTIGATSNNEFGIAGLGRSLSIAPLRILDTTGSGYISDLVAALDYAASNGFAVANMSLTISRDFSSLGLAVSEAADHGVLMVSAAGNNRTSVEWPAAYPEVLAVAATDASDSRATFSNFGDEIDIAAPGADIVSTHLQGGFKPLSGTSMATPHVAALAGLLISLRPDYSRDQVKSVLKVTAEDVNAASWPGDDDELGAGRINMYQALLEASSGLEITGAADAPQTSLVGQPVDFSVHISVPVNDVDRFGNLERLDVTGAVVYYDVVPVGSGLTGIISSSAADGLNRSITENGDASFSVAAPDTAGQYVVRTRVGQTLKEFPLTVFAAPISISLAFSSTTTLVGDHNTPFTVSIWQGKDSLATTSMPLHLETNLGSFANGAQTLDIVVEDGTYQGLLLSSTTAGKATIVASIGATSQQEHLSLVAGPPSQLLGPLNPLPLLDGLSPTLIPLSFSIADQFGNPTSDGTPIQVFSSVGEIVPASLSTVDGAVTAVLSVPAGQTEPIVVWALVPGTQLETRIEIMVLGIHLWFPVVAAT